MADEKTATKMEGIPITAEFIDQFKNDAANGNTTEPGGSGAAMEQLNEAMGWLLKRADSALTKADARYATDPETLDLYGELSVLVAKRNISEDLLKNSPELFLGIITLGLITEKTITYSQIKKENESTGQKAKENE